jgi:HD-GYP domain-containing protein (c-di-GMP phosphodiesterase class II)
MTDPQKQFISALTIAISNCSLYEKEHELIEESAKKTFAMLNEFLNDRTEMMIIDNELVINKLPMRDARLHSTNLVKRFKKKGVSRIDFVKGITAAEIKQFITDLSTTDEAIQTYPHIKTGAVDVNTGSGTADSDIDYALDSLSSFPEEQVEKLKEIYHTVSPFKKLKITDLEAIVARFVATISREVSILKLLSPVKSYSNYTYVHSINVAVLSIFQAESLGLRGKLLHDIGLSAVLHDVGKLFISKEILEKKGKLDEKEFTEITHHPSYGAAYLANIDGIIKMAPIVAFEHHRRYDGTGYPALTMKGKKQHIASQIVAISDFYDALRSWRPYRKSLDTKEVLVLMKKNAGTDFNPMLVDNFVRAFLTAMAKQ